MFFKNKNKKINRQKGITLVIAITVMTLLLSISLSISNIVLRQIRITNINNASKPAFFVADSAVECAFYYDTKPTGGSNSTTDTNSDFATAVFGSSDDQYAIDTISCENKAPLGLTKTFDTNSQVMTTKFDVDYGDMCAQVEVIKSDVSTKIVSRGYNTGATLIGCDLSDIDKRRLVERGLTITY